MARDDLSRAVWRKSSRSGGNGNCVEVAVTGDTVGVRDSKDPAGPVLRFTRSEWVAFLEGIDAGEFRLH
jgi:hypothetical protein